MQLDVTGRTYCWDKLSGLFLVIAIHVGLLYGAWHYQLIPPPENTVTLFVNLVNPPPPKKEEPLPEPPKPPPQKVKLNKPKPVEQPRPQPMLVSNATVTSTSEVVVPEPPPVVETPPAPIIEPAVPPAPSVPVMLSSELSLACPQRTQPTYPATSRRKVEQGRVVLKVSLDESGHITSVKIKQSSGYSRLDEAGLSAIKSWQCNPATRDGVAVRAEALQPFDFILNSLQ